MRIGSLRLAVLIGLVLAGGAARAAERHPAPVPPSLEIEILDPGVDPQGNPAVVLQPGAEGQLQVDIPPVILVHRYYYSGDRSFQGPMLPGGPSIIVVNHPRTGERCYISAQMMPGAPRVTYTEHSIEYDYGTHGITVHFGLLGKPTVKYRSGRPWPEKVGRVLHVEQVATGVVAVAQRTKTQAVGLTAAACDATKIVTLPVVNVLQVLPFGRMLFSPDISQHLAERAAEHERDVHNHFAEERAERDAWSLPTNR